MYPLVTLLFPRYHIEFRVICNYWVKKQARHGKVRMRGVQLLPLKRMLQSPEPILGRVV